MAGVLSIVSGQELDEQAQAEIAAEEQATQDDLAAQTTSQIAHHIRTLYWEMRRNKITLNIQRRILHAQRAYSGQYDTQKLQEIKSFGGSDVFANLTAIKARGATALMRDVFLSGERPWTLEPTPVPDIPGDIRAQIDMLLSAEVQNLMQNGQEPDPQQVEERRRQLTRAANEAAQKVARERAKSATDYVEDMLVEGRFYQAFAEFLIDLPIFPYAIIKGPTYQQEQALQWVEGQPTLVTTPKPYWKRVSPYDTYFTPAASSIEEADVIERIRLRRSDLQALLGLEGYDDEAIYAALDDYTNGLYDNLDDLDTERAEEEDKENPNLNRSNMIDTLEFQGEIQGKYLQTWNGGKAIKGIENFDERLDYNVTAWVVGRHCIKVQIQPNPRKRNNYYGTSFEKVAGALVGRGLPEILDDSQHVANAAFRALVNNMGLACLTGDTVVYKEGSKAGRGWATTTLLDLWQRRRKSLAHLRKTKIRSMDEETGELIANQVWDVFDNGIREVFEVTTARGYRIRATDNHRFMDWFGEWRELKDFAVGDAMGVNGAAQPTELSERLRNKNGKLLNKAVCADCGTPLKHWNSTRCKPCAGKLHSERMRKNPKPFCVDCGVPLKKAGALRCRKHASQFKNSAWNQHQATEAMENRGTNPTTARGRKLVQAQKKDACACCGAIAVRLEVHHRDQDPMNGAPENLVTLCSACHKAEHRGLSAERIEGLKQRVPYTQRFISHDEIISIVPCGTERVFDLQMVGSNKCFIANGLLSHNSGPQVSINEDRMSPTMNSDALYPWKRWRFQSDPLGSTEKPIDFFQPNSNAQELMSIFEKMMNLSDEVSGIPRYMTGNQNVSGAASTASGLNQLMTNASKIMQQVAAQVDFEVIAPLLESLYETVLLTDETGVTWGDLTVRPMGVTMAMARDADRQRQLEFLQLTANPLDQGLVGPKGRAVILRELADNLGLDGEAIIPSEEELKQQEEQQRAQQAAEQQAMQQQAAAQAQGGQPKAPGNLDNRPNRGLDNAQRTRTPQAIANQATP